jgi:hypothetical protein
VSFFKYLKTAFLNHWNLLGFLGSLGFAVLSGWPDVFCPLVLAGEVAYLGLVGTHPKFQKYVDIQEAHAGRQQVATGAATSMQRIMQMLPDRIVRRFEDLRARCAELRHIATELRDPVQANESRPLEELQLAGLDRLLWIYLRLLFTQHMLEQFFRRADETQILHDIQGLEERLRRASEGPDLPQKQKLRKALGENLATCRERLDNYRKARDNSELIQVEIEHLENKIRTLSELAINCQEPDFIIGQVDQVVDGMVQTERTMDELRFATGLDAGDEAVPEILRRGPLLRAEMDARDSEATRRERDEGIRNLREREDEIRFL